MAPTPHPHQLQERDDLLAGPSGTALPSLQLPPVPFGPSQPLRPDGHDPSTITRERILDFERRPPMHTDPAGRGAPIGGGSTLDMPAFESALPTAADARPSDRRHTSRGTPDRRRRPRTYASPWMARPGEGRFDPRPDTEPQAAATLIRPLDARVPTLPDLVADAATAEPVAARADSPAPAGEATHPAAAAALPTFTHLAHLVETPQPPLPDPSQPQLSQPAVVAMPSSGPAEADPLAAVYHGGAFAGHAPATFPTQPLIPQPAACQHPATHERPATMPALAPDVRVAATTPAGWYHRAPGEQAGSTAGEQTPTAAFGPPSAAAGSSLLSRSRAFAGWVLLVAVPAGAGVGLGLLLLRLGIL